MAAPSALKRDSIFDQNMSERSGLLNIFSRFVGVFDYLFSLFGFAKNINGIENGPNTAPIIVQNITFAPLFSAIVPKR